MGSMVTSASPGGVMVSTQAQNAKDLDSIPILGVFVTPTTKAKQKQKAKHLLRFEPTCPTWVLAHLLSMYCYIEGRHHINLIEPVTTEAYGMSFDKHTQVNLTCLHYGYLPRYILFEIKVNLN